MQMRNRMRVATFTVAVFVAAMTTAAAPAATQSHFSDFGPLAVTNGTQVDLSQFDPAKGALTKITITLDASTSGGTIAWDNEAGIASTIQLGIGAEVTAAGPSAFSVVAKPLQLDNGNVDADNDGAADFIGTDSFSVVGGVGNDSMSIERFNPGDFAPYIGLGQVTIDITSQVETFVSTGGGFGPIDPVAGNYSGRVTIEYEFTSVPGPATIALLAIGAVSTRCRRRSPA